MEDKKTGEGFLKSPLNELGQRISVLKDIFKYYELLEFNVNELKNMIDVFTQQAREGCMLVQDGKIVWVNQAVSNILGYQIDELQGMLINDMTTPAMRDKLGARVKMLLAGDVVPLPEEWPVLRSDRTVSFINMFAYRVTFMSKLALMIFFYDVSAAKKQADEQKMRAEMMDSINDAVFLMDMSGKLLYVNESLCETSGYGSEELLQMNILDVTAPELRKRFDIRMKQYSTHKEARYMTTALRKDGTRINVEIRGKIIMQGGQPRLLGVARIVRTDTEPDIEPDIESMQMAD
jgi:PAS domain S-box-containing protein